MIGKWHLGHGGEPRPEGFDYWDVVIDQGDYYDPRFLTTDGVRIEEGYATDIITDLAARLARARGDGDDPCAC